MRDLLRRAVLVVIGAVAGVAGVLALRDATLSTHQRVPPDSEAVIVMDARTKGGERGQTLDEMVEAAVLACRLEVGDSDPIGPPRHLGDGRYETTLVPGLDQTNRRQLRGCLQDWTFDHLLIDVVSISRP